MKRKYALSFIFVLLLVAVFTTFSLFQSEDYAFAASYVVNLHVGDSADTVSAVQAEEGSGSYTISDGISVLPYSWSVPQNGSKKFAGYYTKANGEGECVTNLTFTYSGGEYNTNYSAKAYQASYGTDWYASWKMGVIHCFDNYPSFGSGYYSSNFFINDDYSCQFDLPTRSGYAFGGYYARSVVDTTVSYAPIVNSKGDAIFNQYNSYYFDSYSGYKAATATDGYYVMLVARWFELGTDKDGVIKWVFSDDDEGKTVDISSNTSKGAIVTLSNTDSTTAGTASYYIQTTDSVNKIDTYAANGNVLSSITVPTRTGYTFDGYYANAECSGEKYISSDGTVLKKQYSDYTVASNAVTLYPKWLKNSEITLHINGDASLDETQTYVESVGVTLPTPAFGEFLFQGWYDNSAYDGTAVTAVGATDTGDKTFYAKWAGTVHFANTADGATVDALMTYSVSSALRTNSFVYSGYRFMGWDKDDDGNVDYNDGENLSLTQAEITLETVWRKEYEIRLHINGDASLDETQTYVESVGATLSTPAFGEFLFQGWYDNSAYEGTAVTAVGATDTGDKTFYAKWAGTVHFANTADGATVDALMTYSVSSALRTNSFVYSGYRFMGWDKDDDGNVDYNDGDDLTLLQAELTLKTIWVDLSNSSVGAALDGVSQDTQNEIVKAVEKNPDNTYSITVENSDFCDTSLTYATYEEAIVAAAEAVQKTEGSTNVETFVETKFDSISSALPTLTNVTASYEEKYKAVLADKMSKTDEGYYYDGNLYTTLNEALAQIVLDVKTEILNETKNAVNSIISSSKHDCDGALISASIEFSSSNVDNLDLDDCENMLEIYNKAMEELQVKKYMQTVINKMAEEYNEAYNKGVYTQNSLTLVYDVYVFLATDMQQGIQSSTTCEAVDTIYDLWSQTIAAKLKYCEIKITTQTGADAESVEKIESADAGFEDGVVLSIAKDVAVDETLKNQVKEATKDKYNNVVVAAVYDINITKDGAKYETDGTYTVTLALPEELKNCRNISVAFLNDDGSVEYFDCTVVDSTLVFSTTHFSRYIVVAEKNVSLWWAVIPAVLILILIVCYVVVSKKESKEVKD